MKILQVIDSLNIGGAEKMCVQLSNLFCKKGHEVTVLYFIQSEQDFVDQLNLGVEILYIKKQLYNPLFYLKVANCYREYELIHVHLTSTIKVIFLSSLLLPRRKPTVFHDHTGSVKLFDETSKGIILKEALKKFKYVAVYEDLRKRTLEKYKLPQNQTSVISNFVERSPEVKIKVLPFSTDNLSILVIGNIKPQKNQLFLIELAQKLIEKGSNSPIFNLIGKIQDKDYYNEFKMQVESNGLLKHFTVYDIYNDFRSIDLSANLALMTSIDESGPLVNIEYLLLGLPFVSHKVGDISNTISRVLPGLVLDNLNPNFWAEHILKFERFQDLVYRYENVYNEYFSDEIAYQKWKKCYDLTISEVNKN